MEDIRWNQEGPRSLAGLLLFRAESATYAPFPTAVFSIIICLR